MPHTWPPPSHSKLQLGVNLLQAIEKESCREVVHTGLGKSGVFATLWAGEGLVYACPQGEVVDALLAVVMTAREHLWLCVVLMTDGTDDLFLQILDNFFHHVFVFSHS